MHWSSDCYWSINWWNNHSVYMTTSFSWVEKTAYLTAGTTTGHLEISFERSSTWQTYLDRHCPLSVSGPTLRQGRRQLTNVCSKRRVIGHHLSAHTWQSRIKINLCHGVRQNKIQQHEIQQKHINFASVFFILINTRSKNYIYGFLFGYERLKSY